MGAGQQANVAPLQIQLKPGAQPVRVPTGTYSMPQMRFMEAKLKENDELGLIRRNPASEWASPPLILPKPGPEGFRFTMDLRVPNAQTVSTVWPMPYLAESLTDFEGSMYCTMVNLISVNLTGNWDCILAVTEHRSTFWRVKSKESPTWSNKCDDAYAGHHAHSHCSRRTTTI
jgi:hypothetical protein